MFYIIEVRDSDGNDCTVYNMLVRASDREEAVQRVFDEWVDEVYPDDERDGGYGTYHPCECLCEHGKPIDECDYYVGLGECSHGGLLVSAPEEAKEYHTEKAARANLASYHTLIDLSEPVNA